MGAFEKRNAMKECLSFCRAALTDGEGALPMPSPEALRFAKKQDLLHLLSVGARRLSVPLSDVVNALDTDLIASFLKNRRRSGQVLFFNENIDVTARSVPWLRI